MEKKNRVPFRRRREGKTDYRYRLKLLKSGKPRVVARKSNTNMRVQFVLYDRAGDRTISSAISNELKKYGWNGSVGNTPASYLTGLLAGKRALIEGIKEGVMDIGPHESIKGANIYGALKGVLDAGIDVSHGEDVIPDDDRIYGKHISEEMPDKVKEIKEKIEAEYE
ncbi:MAG: 50S ribosomal protein L18 [Candidatus Thermoplasmatota archaeon]|nr:50S ribosomal protein L18 [Candidatus Thermoplasmatota archaeon]